jgi:mannosyltransferase OCH1-like enzyme
MSLSEIEGRPLVQFIMRFSELTSGIKTRGDEQGDFDYLMMMAIDLRGQLKYDDAANFFGKAFTIDRKSPDALIARLSCVISGRGQIDPLEIQELRSLNDNYYALFEAKRLHLSEHPDSKLIIQTLNNRFEAFHSGSEADWIFIEHAGKFHHSFSGANSYLFSPIPKNLFMYWDHNPPSEILENFEHHRALKYFNLLNFSKESASEFLASSYGYDCRRMFLSLRHPSEESDFFRFHAINSLGGYYLDADEQIISVKHFNDAVASNSKAIFILSQNQDGSVGPVHSAFFGAVKEHPIIQDSIMTLYRNIHFYNDLSLWLKSGPGPVTRAISRNYYKALFLGHELPSFHLMHHTRFGAFIRAVDVSYRNDARDWRVHEATR